jgi:hypothetical protein
LNNALTQIGGQLLTPINSIRDAVVAIAGQHVPGFLDVSGTHEASDSPLDDKQIAKLPPGSQRAVRAQKSTLEKSALQFFIAKGWKPVEAAAIVGRLVEESNLDTAVRGDGGLARGVAQWHADRWNKLTTWAKKNGLDPLSHAAQFGYVDYELRHDFAGAGGALRMAGDQRGRMGAMLAYERPRGYGLVPYERVTGWDVQRASTQRLLGELDVNIRHPDGTKETRRVALNPVGAPRPAGTAGGRAPLVNGTISY